MPQPTLHPVPTSRSLSHADAGQLAKPFQRTKPRHLERLAAAVMAHAPPLLPFSRQLPSKTRLLVATSDYILGLTCNANRARLGILQNCVRAAPDRARRRRQTEPAGPRPHSRLDATSLWPRGPALSRHRRRTRRCPLARRVVLFPAGSGGRAIHAPRIRTRHIRVRQIPT
jgi:hypothetical protein